MRWADGRTFRGFGACSALIASLVHKVEMVQNVYDQPSVGAGTFVIGVVTRQRLLATGQLIEISRNWGHKVRKGKVVEIYEHFQSLLLFHEAGDRDGLSSDGPVNGQVPTRVLVPFDDAIAWLSTHGA
jgi:hypothetical protein